MPRKESINVDVEPSVLHWIIDSSGWTNEEIAKRLNTNIQNIRNILSGQKKPTFRQLKELSLIFKRPIAAFLLPKPRAEKPKPKDYRMLPDRVDKFDKKTLLVLRKARRLQELSRELSKNINYETKSKLKRAGISEKPEKIAETYRKIFDLTEEKQRASGPETKPNSRNTARRTAWLNSGRRLALCFSSWRRSLWEREEDTVRGAYTTAFSIRTCLPSRASR